LASQPASPGVGAFSHCVQESRAFPRHSGAETETFKLTAIRPIQALHDLTSPKLLAIASLTTPPDTGLADKHHVVSIHYLDDGDNNTLFFLVLIVLVVGLSYLFLRLDLFVVQLAVMSLSFCGHYYLDNQYHVAGSWLGRFSWFRRKQQLHFTHHRHGNCNFAVIDYFWDRLLEHGVAEDALDRVRVT
jgi:hypothetical protein